MAWQRSGVRSPSAPLIERVRAGPLGQREFRFLFLGRTTSFVGNAFANVALAFAVLDLTGSKADLGFVLAARTIPQVLFLLVGGIWADRLPRHRVMVFSNVVSGLSQGVIAVLLLTGEAEVWQLAALGAINGLSAAFFFPAATCASARTRAGSGAPRSEASSWRRRAPGSGSPSMQRPSLPPRCSSP